ncbi:sugar transferase [Angustibacter speluncae]
MGAGSPSGGEPEAGDRVDVRGDRLEVVHHDRLEVVDDARPRPDDRLDLVRADHLDVVPGQPTTEPAVPVAERRHAPVGERLSWATGLPFHRDDLPDPEGLRRAAERRRSTWVLPLQRRMAATDALCAFVAMGLGLWSLPATSHLWLPGAFVWAVAWLSLLSLVRGYDRHLVGDGPEEFQSVLRAAVLSIAIMGVVAFSLQLLLPRRAVLVAVPATMLLTMLARYVWRRRLHRRRGAGAAMLRTLVVGEPLAVASLSTDLARERHHGLEVVGSCIPVRGPDIDPAAGVDVLGVISQVPQVVVDHTIDAVIVVGSKLTGPSLRRLSWALESTGAELMVAPGLIEVTGPHVSLRPAAGLSLLRVERPSNSSGRLLGKAVLDRVVGVGAALAALPVVLVAALLVRVTSPGPAFYPQRRVGRDGVPFTMWKLRSMVQDADRLRAELAQDNEGDGLLFKMRRDPRITPVGRFLRRFSVDELPQLWNVVKGDMSLVGPRPPLVEEYEQYHDEIHRRLRVRPGLTGLWQVSGRSDLTWDESVRLDLRYVDNWSLAMDLQILWKTARAVVVGSGAY